MTTFLDRDPGSTSLTAFDIGILDSRINFTNSIDNDDTTDIYNFSLNQTSQIELLIEVNNINGVFIDKNNNGDVDASESILPYTHYAYLGADSNVKTTLGVGTYSIRLEGYSYNNYSLNLTATPAPASTEIDPGNTLFSSLNLGHLNNNLNNSQITEFIGSVDQTDLYRFSMDKGQLKLDIEKLTGKELGGTVSVDLIRDYNHNEEIDDGDILFNKTIDYYSWDDDNYVLNFAANETFDSGNYFIRFEVSEYDDHTNTNYTFNLASSLESDTSNDNTKIYRFFRPDKGSHFYTASAIERDYVSENLPEYQYEGASYQAVTEERDLLTGAKPVYRFFNRSTGVHLYTISDVEKEYIINNLANYNFENIAYYAHENPQEGTIPLYRFDQALAGTHFFTPSAAERDYVSENLPWYQEEGNQGIAFYVEPL